MRCPSSMTELDQDIEEYGYVKYNYKSMPYVKNDWDSFSNINYVIFEFIEYLNRHKDFKYSNWSSPDYRFRIFTNLHSQKVYKIYVEGEYIMVRKYYNKEEYKLYKRKKVINKMLK